MVEIWALMKLIKGKLLPLVSRLDVQISLQYLSGDMILCRALKVRTLPQLPLFQVKIV